MGIKTVGVIGSGTMGAGIAQISALSGYDVVVYDLSAEFLTRAEKSVLASIDKGVARGKTAEDVAAAAKTRLRWSTDLADVAATDLIIEAAPESLDLKRDLFSTLDTMSPAHTIFASNTSSLSINAIGAATQRPEQVVGLHFFNPAHIMKLVEIIRGELTTDETVQAGRTFAESLGKQPVLCKDTPAFIVNRVARPFYGEAFRIMGENVADAETIDTLMRSIGFKMGPLELIDLIGCDVNLTVTEAVYDAYYQDPKYRPHPIQRRMVESGWLGRKTGRGFYDHSEKK